jgi:acyl carrier protein
MNVSEMVALVQQAIANVCGVDVDRVRPDANLVDLGVDSLAAAEVLVSLEMRLGKQLPVDVMRRLDEVQTVAQIAAHFDLAFTNAARS